jgi:hypothetical protein
MTQAWMALVVGLGLTTGLVAQAPTPAVPVLTEVEALRVQALELAIENQALRLNILRRDAEAYMRSLEKPGFTLVKERDAAGVTRWVYMVAVP